MWYLPRVMSPERKSVVVGSRRYLRRPEPLIFPSAPPLFSDEEMPENQEHLELRTWLWQLIREEYGGQVFVGSD